MNFCENVDAELKYLGISRKELAQSAGFNVSNIANGIRDSNIPSADTALKISSFLGVSMKYLFSGNENDRNEEDKKPENKRNAIISMILAVGN